MSLRTLCRQPENGGVLVEYSLGLILFLTLVGIIVDLGVGLYHYNIVKKSTLTSTRQVTQDYAVKVIPKVCAQQIPALSSIDSMDEAACLDLAACAKLVAQTHLSAANSALLNRTQFNSTFTQYVPRGAAAADAGEPAYYMLSTDATFEALCAFCGVLPKLGFQLGNQVAMQNKLVCS